MKSNKIPMQSYGKDPAMIEIKRNLENLHTTLPMPELINLFESEIREIVTYDSFEYDQPEQAIHVFKGVPKLHKCRYRLSATGVNLGNVTLSRRKPFKEDEMLLVEKALGTLSVHLNNAMDYQASLDEEQVTSFKVDAEMCRVR